MCVQSVPEGVPDAWTSPRVGQRSLALLS
jgi:hypothetical protein